MPQQNPPDDGSPRPALEIDLEALRRDRKYQLVETLDYVAYSSDTRHHGTGRSEEEALAALLRLAPDAQDVRCSRIMVRVPRRSRPQGSDECRDHVT